jgi:hypothetical protein
MAHTTGCDWLGGRESSGKVPNRDKWERPTTGKIEKKIETSVSYLFNMKFVMNMAQEDRFLLAYHEQH